MTKRKPRYGRLTQITRYLDPTEPIKCSYGTVPVRKWLELELARLKKNKPDRRVEIRGETLYPEKFDGKIALFVE
ncbi:MAG: hypothetical protein ACE5EK_00150 [Nitrospinales bacterium]